MFEWYILLFQCTNGNTDPSRVRVGGNLTSVCVWFRDACGFPQTLTRMIQMHTSRIVHRKWCRRFDAKEGSRFDIIIQLISHIMSERGSVCLCWGDYEDSLCCCCFFTVLQTARIILTNIVTQTTSIIIYVSNVSAFKSVLPCFVFNCLSLLLYAPGSLFNTFVCTVCNPKQNTNVHQTDLFPLPATKSTKSVVWIGQVTVRRIHHHQLLLGPVLHTPGL